jgi:hypothetical protein
VYGTITQGSNPTFSHPFGTPSAPTGTQLLSAGSGQPLRHVVTELKHDNGIGGQHETGYAYLGVGLESTQNWGFVGFYAQRIQDEVSEVATYVQYRLHYPYFGQAARVLQYDDLYGSHTQTLARVENDYDQEVTYDDTIDAVYPYLKRSVNFLYEAGTVLGVTETLNTPTLSGGLITEIVSTLSTAEGHSEGTAGSIWGDVPPQTLSSYKHATRTITEFDNRTSVSVWPRLQLPTIIRRQMEADFNIRESSQPTRSPDRLPVRPGAFPTSADPWMPSPAGTPLRASCASGDPGAH